MNNLQELELTTDFVDIPQSLDLKELGLEELNENEMSEIEGGVISTGTLVGLGVGALLATGIFLYFNY